MSAEKAKYDWYQTESDVIVTVLLKGITEDNLSVNFSSQNLSVTVKQPDKGSDYCLDVDLFGSITPEKCSWKILPSKLEVKLRKAEGQRWSKLESDGTNDASQKTYPTSCAKGPQDWDRLAKEAEEEEKTEKLEGDAAVNQLFQKIYADADDETKKAMIKSFTESKGTVLSTNWSEVGQKKVTCKPPDGMEFKKYEK